jgi:hypothetical protein
VVALSTDPARVLDEPLKEQRTLLELQGHDSAIDRLDHERASLPELARLAQLGEALVAVDQLSAERQGALATIQRQQSRLEDEIEMVTGKARSEELGPLAGNVTSPGS